MRIDVHSNWEVAGEWFRWGGLQMARPLHYGVENILECVCPRITPSEYGNCSTWTLEAVRRTAILSLAIPGSVLALAPGIIGGGVERVGDWMAGMPFTHLRSDVVEKEFDGSLSVFNLNACMFQMGLPIALDGLTPASYRTEALANLLRERDPDVVLLQEVGHDPARDLWNRLRDHYPHGFIRIDAMPPFAIETCLMVLCKHEVQSVDVIPFPDQGGMRRGAFAIETEHYRALTTHLEFGNRSAMRAAQLDLIEAWARGDDKPTVIAGDFNDEYDPFEGFENAEHNAPYTCHNPIEVERLGSDLKERTIDYLWTKGLSAEETEVLEAGSDHLALFSRLIL